MQLHSVLEGVGPDAVQDLGFPLLIKPNALPEAYYHALEASYPGFEKTFGGPPADSNHRYRLEAQRCLGDPNLHEIWREFLRYHTSPAFFQEIAHIFGDAINQAHPGIERNFGKPLEHFSVGPRHLGKRRNKENFEHDVVLEAQFAWTTPVRRLSSSRGPHLDGDDKLYTALLYFREPGDDAPGGDLIFHRLRDTRYPRPKPSRIDPDTVEPIVRIPYEPNTLVLFVNSAQAIHSVSPRAVTGAMRRFVVLMGDCYKGRVPDFLVAPETRSPFWWRRLRRYWNRYRG